MQRALKTCPLQRWEDEPMGFMGSPQACDQSTRQDTQRPRPAMPGCVQLDRPFPCVVLTFSMCEMEFLMPACSPQSQWDEAYKCALLMTRLTYIPNGPSLPGPWCFMCTTTAQWALPALTCQDFHPSAGLPLCMILREPHPRDSIICVNLLHSPGIAPCPACTLDPAVLEQGLFGARTGRKSVLQRTRS